MEEADSTEIDLSGWVPLSTLSSLLALPPSHLLPECPDALQNLFGQRDKGAILPIFEDESDGWLLQPEQLRGQPDDEYFQGYTGNEGAPLTHSCVRFVFRAVASRPH